MFPKIFPSQLYLILVVSIVILLSMETSSAQMRSSSTVNKTDSTSTGILQKLIEKIRCLPKKEGSKQFRTPCKTENRCSKVIKRLMVPKLAQLENMMMGVMKELQSQPLGSPLPDKSTKTEPMRLLLDQNYKQDVCTGKLETCLREDKRRKRILRKLFLRKHNIMREGLIGYGGRGLWGGDGNLFYKK